LTLDLFLKTHNSNPQSTPQCHTCATSTSRTTSKSKGIRGIGRDRGDSAAYSLQTAAVNHIPHHGDISFLYRGSSHSFRF